MEKLPHENELVQRAKKDPEAFGILYDFYYTRIFRFILFRVANNDVAKDLASETFFQALKNIWRFRFVQRPFSAWLYKIASTQIAMYFREKIKYCELTREEYPEILTSAIANNESPIHMMELIDRKEDFKKMHNCIRQLRGIEQSIIVLRYFEAKSLLEVSELLGMKINTVKSHTRRALQHLKKIFSKDFNNPYGKTQGQRRIGEALEGK